MVDINNLLNLARQYKTNPLDTTQEARQLLDAIDENKDGTVDSAETDSFTKAGANLQGDDKTLFDTLVKLVDVAKKVAPPKFDVDANGNLKIKTVGGREVSIPKDQLTVSHLSNPVEEQAWRDQINNSKGKAVIVDSVRGLDIVKKGLAGADPLADPTKAADNLVKELWENKDGINVNGKFEERRIIRMEEILGAQNLIKELEAKDPAKAAEFKKQFFAKMGEYINKFGKEAQFTFDTFVALFQSTAWGEGGHTNDLKKFYEEMLQGMAQTANVTKDKLANLKNGESVVLSNYDGTQDGNPFGSLAFVASKDASGSVSFDFVEHATAPKENRAIGVDSGKFKSTLSSALDEVSKLDQSKLSEQQKNAIKDLKSADIPAILGGGKDGLSTLLGNLKILAGIPGIKPETLAQINDLIKQVEKLLAQAENKPAEQSASPTPTTQQPGPAAQSPSQLPPGGALPGTQSSLSPQLQGLKTQLDELNELLKKQSPPSKIETDYSDLSKEKTRESLKSELEGILNITGLDPVVKQKVQEALTKVNESLKPATTQPATPAFDLNTFKADTISFFNKLKGTPVNDSAGNVGALINKLSVGSSLQDVNNTIAALEGIKTSISSSTMENKEELARQIGEMVSKIKTYYASVLEPSRSSPPMQGDQSVPK